MTYQELIESAPTLSNPVTLSNDDYSLEIIGATETHATVIIEHEIKHIHKYVLVDMFDMEPYSSKFERLYEAVDSKGKLVVCFKDGRYPNFERKCRSVEKYDITKTGVTYLLNLETWEIISE